MRLTRNAIKSKFIYNDQGMLFGGARSWSRGNDFVRSLNHLMGTIRRIIF